MIYYFFSRLQNYISLYFLLPIRKVSPKQFYFSKNLSEEKFVGIIFWSLEKLGSGLSCSADLHPMLWKVSPLFGIGKQELILGKRCMKQFWAYSTWHLFIRSVSEHLSLVHLWQIINNCANKAKVIVYKSFVIVQDGKNQMQNQILFHVKWPPQHFNWITLRRQYFRLYNLLWRFLQKIVW